ncbi:Spo0E family sporulation regulatory protein-aspartic acid phosphatase [Clostridium chromiireducens]|uniref:Spo0E family sporulation regulatory protein-aspartic acid phosphatase n=1 Tax=Clostridium chromiireducens TaxID=225345 RepID=A0A964W3R9_9CLOT|nr:Spo0E family sporulation regulatory protein-aspartic acid phosphatase [Clostridium chromiireducens]
MKEFARKIEIVREILHKKIEENIDKKEILRISQELDKLIVNYLLECTIKAELR